VHVYNGKCCKLLLIKMGKFTDRDPNNSYGYGIPDADNLVQKLLNPAVVKRFDLCLFPMDIIPWILP
jgi:hypothetical protein